MKIPGANDVRQRAGRISCQSIIGGWFRVGVPRTCMKRSCSFTVLSHRVYFFLHASRKKTSADSEIF